MLARNSWVPPRLRISKSMEPGARVRNLESLGSGDHLTGVRVLTLGQPTTNFFWGIKQRQHRHFQRFGELVKGLQTGIAPASGLEVLVILFPQAGPVGKLTLGPAPSLAQPP